MVTPIVNIKNIYQNKHQKYLKNQALRQILDEFRTNLLSSLHLNSINFQDKFIQIKFNDKTIGRFFPIQNSFMFGINKSYYLQEHPKITSHP